MAIDLVTWLLANPEVGWVVVILYLMWEIRGPKGKINDLSERIAGIVVVVRALASVNQNIDTEKVNDYLIENGSQPEDFIEQKPPVPKEDEFTKGDDEQGANQSGSSGD